MRSDYTREKKRGAIYERQLCTGASYRNSCWHTVKRNKTSYFPLYPQVLWRNSSVAQPTGNDRLPTDQQQEAATASPFPLTLAGWRSCWAGDAGTAATKGRTGPARRPALFNGVKEGEKVTDGINFLIHSFYGVFSPSYTHYLTLSFITMCIHLFSHSLFIDLLVY